MTREILFSRVVLLTTIINLCKLVIYRRIAA